MPRSRRCGQGPPFLRVEAGAPRLNSKPAPTAPRSPALCRPGAARGGSFLLLLPQLPARRTAAAHPGAAEARAAAGRRKESSGLAAPPSRGGTFPGSGTAASLHSKRPGLPPRPPLGSLCRLQHQSARPRPQIKLGIPSPAASTPKPWHCPKRQKHLPDPSIPIPALRWGRQDTGFADGAASAGRTRLELILCLSLLPLPDSSGNCVSPLVTGNQPAGGANKQTPSASTLPK